jgi:antitoxin CptB
MEKEIRLKRLLYQSLHRGCKETDMILGNFANKHLMKLSDTEIDLYENFINEKDWDIYAWVIGAQNLPEKHDNDVVKMILDEGVKI